MKASLLVIVVTMLCIASAACGATATVPPGQLVKDMPLQAFSHTPHPWQLKVYQSVNSSVPDLGPSGAPVQVCFVQAPIPGQVSTICAPLSVAGWSYQTFDSARLRILPGPDREPDRPSLVVRATARTGPAGEDVLRGVFVWTFHAGSGFLDTFQSAADLSGQQEFVTRGPLRGAFVKVTQVSEGDEKTRISPRHFQMTVYEPVRFGYVEVLSILSSKRYVSGELGEGIQNPITTLTPEIVHALQVVYPKGVYASAVQR